MKNLIFSFLIAFSTISLAEEVTSQKEVDVYKTKKILSELPQDKIKALINVKKNILNDEINFRNRFIELRSLSNIALKENNENKYKTLMEEIGLLKDEMEFIRNDEINFRNRFIELRSLSNIALKENNENKYKTLMEEIGLLKDEMEFIRFYRLQEIENILGTEIPYFYNDETMFDYLNLI